MEESVRDEKKMTEDGQNVFGESCLCAAAHKIVPDESAGERIIEGAKTGKRSRRRLTPAVPAAVLAACLLLSLLCLTKPGLIGEDVVVYAATEEHGWQKLEEGERILLKMEPYQSLGEEEEAFDDRGESTYWPYKCTFRVVVPENCRYDRQMVMVRDDHIWAYGDKIEWWVAPERPEDAGRVMQGSFRLWIVDENLHKTAALDLELIKEDGKCYAELKRAWGSEA